MDKLKIMYKVTVTSLLASVSIIYGNQEKSVRKTETKEHETVQVTPLYWKGCELERDNGVIGDKMPCGLQVGYCYRWTPGDIEWTRRTSMLTRRQSHAMFSYQDRIYVMGGYTAGDLEDLSLGRNFLLPTMLSTLLPGALTFWEALLHRFLW